MAKNPLDLIVDRLKTELLRDDEFAKKVAKDPALKVTSASGTVRVEKSDPKINPQQQVKNSIELIENFINGDQFKKMTTAIDKISEFKTKMSELIADVNKEHSAMLKEFQSDILNDLKTHHDDMESSLKNVLNEQTILTELRDQHLKQKTEIEESMSKLTRNINGNLSLIIQRIFYNGESITSANMITNDLQYKQCLNRETEVKGGWIGSEYFNCNHIGNGDFADLVSSLLQKQNNDNTLILNCCTMHEQFIRNSSALSIIAQSKISKEPTSFLFISKWNGAGTDTSTQLKKFALANTLHVNSQYSLYMQLLKDIFGNVTYDNSNRLSNVLVFNYNALMIHELLKTSMCRVKDLRSINSVNRDIIEMQINMSFSALQNVEVTYTARTSTGIRLQGDIPDFKGCFDKFVSCELVKFLLPTHLAVTNDRVFINTLRKMF